MRNIRCLNCDEEGHVYKNCKNPIVSYGIIAYKVIKGKLNFLMIRRKDTMGFADFVRGKYKESNKKELLNTFIEEMTDEEKIKIKTKDFESIWEDLWVCKNSGIYVTEKEKARYKFNNLNLDELPLDVPSKYSTQEYGFPKGRKNNNEKPIECAIREFTEETGFCKKEISIDHTINPLTESFIGSNGVKYTHIYYIAQVISDREPSINKNNMTQLEEISKVEYCLFSEAYGLIRDYDTQKKKVLYEANDLIIKRLKKKFRYRHLLSPEDTSKLHIIT